MHTYILYISERSYACVRIISSFCRTAQQFDKDRAVNRVPSGCVRERKRFDSVGAFRYRFPYMGIFLMKNHK